MAIAMASTPLTPKFMRFGMVAIKTAITVLRKTPSICRLNANTTSEAGRCQQTVPVNFNTFPFSEKSGNHDKNAKHK